MSGPRSGRGALRLRRQILLGTIMSRNAAKRSKPSKPYPSFPLTPHNNGQWCKKIKGRLYFFGPWADPDAAFSKYTRDADALHSGRPVNVHRDGLDLKELGNAYLASQLARLEAGDLGGRAFEERKRVITEFVKFVGARHEVEVLTPNDFAKYRASITEPRADGSQRGVRSVELRVTYVRHLFRWAVEAGMIEQEPRYGPNFKKPSSKDKRLSRARRSRAFGAQFFDAEEVRRLLAASSGQLRACILVGVNGGFANTDCAELPRAAVDLEAAVIHFERPKTGIDRVIPLWPETVEAIGAVMRHQALPICRSERGVELVFSTEHGNPLVRTKPKLDPGGRAVGFTAIDRLGQWFDDLQRSIGIKRSHRGFRALRHTFQTLADEARDPHAAKRIMGHAIDSITEHYLEEIGLDRLRAVTDHVRARVFS